MLISDTDFSMDEKHIYCMLKKKVELKIHQNPLSEKISTSCSTWL